MNWGRCLGEAQLRIFELEERAGKRAAKAGDPAVVEALQAELAQAQNSETAALIRLGKEKEARVLAERKAADAFERIAKLEQANAKRPDAQRAAELNERNTRQAELIRGYKFQIADQEARLNGTAQQISELKRQLDDAQAGVGKLKAQLDEANAQPVPSECPVCTPIIQAIARVTQRDRIVMRPSDMLPGVPRFLDGPAGNRTRAVKGYTAGIVSALERATAPMNCGELGEAIGLDQRRVATNVWHLHRDGIVIKLGQPGRGTRPGYRYWLASRPLPEGVTA